jgi:thiaminase
MPQHHPGTFVAKSNLNPSDLPNALTTYLISINHDQLLRTTRHPFLARAANGTLPKALVEQWLANDLAYLAVYKGISEQTLALVRHTSSPEDVESRLVAWLEAAVQNGTREQNLFGEVAQIYGLDLTLTKNLGLTRYESLFADFTSTPPNTFLPWLEGAVILWAMEKVYYEAWSWSRKQDVQTSPRSYENDLDGGAMRREFIPNWSNRDFLMFVEQLERIINEGVSTSVKGDDKLWAQVRDRTEGVWRGVLNAEEAFWPDVDGSHTLQNGGIGGATTELNGNHLNGTSGCKTCTNRSCEECARIEHARMPVRTVA